MIKPNGFICFATEVELSRIEAPEKCYYYNLNAI